MDDKVYYPTVIDDVPFPQKDTFVQSGNQTGGETNTPQTTKEQNFPRKRIAQETISSALNTRSRKILQQFELAQSGGIQIGKYQNGVSGDVRMTPAGITSRNTAGNPTFGLDGETGDAVFGGRVLADAFIGANGNIVIEESANGNGRIVLYVDGVASIVIGDPS